ncbi:MAG: hypothetical protein R3310_16260 [Candidatus Competibacteraceae bacterium]|nr:hypothetical protein [Candidatus Competibacteraceae bacterium]
MHAIQPTLCPACADELRHRVAEGQQTDGYAYCPHHQALAIIKTRERRILDWHLLGPVEQDRALEMINEILLGAARLVARPAAH